MESRSLKICLVTERFPILGRSPARGFIAPIARGLVRAGHQVSVIAWSNPFGESEIEQEGIRTYFLAGSNPRRLELFARRAQQKFLELHQREQFQMVHSLTQAAHRIGAEKKRRGFAIAYDVSATQMGHLFSLIGMGEPGPWGQIRTAYRVANQFLRSYYLNDRLLLRNADGVFVHSPQQKLALERYYLYPELKTYNIPYGIELSDLSPRQGSDELRQKLGIPLSSQIVVTVSDMTETQDLLNILRAFQSVVIKKPSARLIIVGYGPHFKQIEYEMLNLALGSHVLMLGSVAPYEISQYIDLADIFVNISGRSSGYDPNLLEAMIQEKVIIGSEVSPIATFVEDGMDGFLIRPADINALSNLMLGLFLGQLRPGPMGKNARAKALNIFDTQKMIGSLLDAYSQILARCPWVRLSQRVES